MVEEADAQQGKAPPRRQPPTVVLALLGVLVVAAGFALGLALAPGSEAEAEEPKDGESPELVAATTAAEQASEWSKGLRRGLDAGAMSGFQAGAVEGEQKGTRAGYAEIIEQGGDINVRSESENDIGYEAPEGAELVLIGEATPAKYAALWAQMSPEDKAWAHKVSFCESHHDPNVLGLGGEYRGAFQFTMDAWRISPNSPGGDPIDYSYKVQAVVAVSLMHEMGTGPWPVCGS